MVAVLLRHSLGRLARRNIDTNRKIKIEMTVHNLVDNPYGCLVLSGYCSCCFQAGVQTCIISCASLVPGAVAMQGRDASLI